MRNPGTVREDSFELEGKYFNSIHVSGVQFRWTERVRGIRPKDVKSLSIELNMNLTRCYERGKKYFDETGIPDHISELIVQIDIHGKTKDAKKYYYNSWHLDQDVDDKGSGGRQEYPHPLFHLHNGGRHLQELVESEDYGDICIFPSPRIMHLPLDYFLAVDFILSNFYPNDWYALREDNQYINFMKKTQIVYWKPFIGSMNDFWGTDADKKKKAVELLPQYA